MASRNLKNRTLLFNKELDDSDLEFDYLTRLDVDYASFETTEQAYYVKQADIGRMDFISTTAYGSPYYWWIIADRNHINNPVEDMTIGQLLFVPSLSDYFDFYNKNVLVGEVFELDFDTRSLT